LRAGNCRLGLSSAGSAGGVEFGEVIGARYSISFVSTCELDEPCASDVTDGEVSLVIPALERHRGPKPPTYATSSSYYLPVHSSSWLPSSSHASQHQLKRHRC
jgi:hypothetical protein